MGLDFSHSNCSFFPSASGSFDLLDNTDIHLHFPAGAVTKDGPSAGVTIVTCLASLFSGRLVCSDVAMTGEITLRGLVLPVSVVAEKSQVVSILPVLAIKSVCGHCQTQRIAGSLPAAGPALLLLLLLPL